MAAEIFTSCTDRQEDWLAHRALGDVTAPTYALLGRQERWPSLEARGWSHCASPSDHSPLHLLVVRDKGGPVSGILQAGVRPWVCLVPGRRDETHAAALTSLGYRAVWFDGASSYLLAPGHEELQTLLDHPAQPGECESAQVAALRADLTSWRERALEGWSTSAAALVAQGRGGGAEDLARELAAIRSTFSWRVTAPLRAVRLRYPAR